MLYADDVLLLSVTRDGLQVLIDLTCSHFASLGLTVNPGKSDIVIFDGGRTANPRSFNIAQMSKDTVDEAKYLGVIFHRGGKWKCQLETTLARCRMARGRCHIICSSLGLQNTKSIVQMFDIFVSSIYRYSIGTWGVTAGALHKLDDLFCDYIRRQFRLPPKTCRRGILMQFGRRCACCDARFLAAVQIARGLVNPVSVWGRVLKTVWTTPNTPWVREVRNHLAAMNIENLVFSRPAQFLSERKEWGIRFSKFCHSEHLLFTNGRSSDQFRLERPFGMYPVVYDLPVEQSRVLLSFVLSCWKWTFNLRGVPDYCATCDCMMNSWHVMFSCGVTRVARDEFFANTCRHFSITILRDSTVNKDVIRCLSHSIRLLREQFDV
jgi:hypothetical protein